MRLALLLLLTLLLVSCGFMRAPPSYDPEDADFIRETGTASLSGTAAFPTPDGPVSCAGRAVSLIPASRYARAVVRRDFGSARGGRAEAVDAARVTHPAAFRFDQKTALCDAEGRFAFVGIADGTYYVVAEILWAGDGVLPEGGVLAERVRIRRGRNARVVLG
ncbi:MAG: hypothetical protein AAF390_12760 [Pseudomonadota bacterium]